MSHDTSLSSTVEDNLTKYWAVCTCGWTSLKYNNSYNAGLAAGLHKSDYV